ncbi:MAG: FHA domain-containing protein [Myxococcales bacterium]|nr:FHA domain-containing protein [Myxococcales bacterium]
MSIDFVKAGLIIAWTPDRIRIGEIFPLGEELIFGREPSIFPGGPLDDTMISRRHFQLERAEEGTYELVDLHSSNGTSVNGSNVNRAVLKDGHWLRAGDTFMVYRRFPPTLPINQMWGMDSMLPSVGPAFGYVRHLCRELGGSRRPVLVVGPPGAAKRQIAEQIHFKGDPDAPCLSMDGNAPIEQDLVNVLQEARGGTLILRHVDHLSLHAQQILKNAIAVEFDVRMLATANRPVSEIEGDGHLAPELLRHFAQSVIEVPPLNDHIEDMIPWVLHYLRECDEEERTLDPTLINALFTLCWSENYRQLKAIIDVALSEPAARLTLSKNVAKELLGVPSLTLSSQLSQSFKKTAPY